MGIETMTQRKAPQAQTSAKMPLRILEVVGDLNMGGTETWLLNVLRHIDRERFHMDFLVHKTRPGAYDQQIKELGSKVLVCTGTSQPWVYARNFRRILNEYGPYDIVHSHVHHYSGYVLRLAHQAGVPIRVAHSHNTIIFHQGDRTSLPRRLYLSLARRLVARHATAGLAASRDAAYDLFGLNWQNDPRWRVLYCGIDTEAFRSPAGVGTARAELGFRPDDLVIGHVGRFEEQKNHRFLVSVAAEAMRREPRARLLLVGDGALRPEIERLVAQEGLAGRVRFAGVRGDVPRLMAGAMDVFLFPSRWEGLGLSLVEAQAAGLPCVASNTIPEEAFVVPALGNVMSLEEPASVWASTVLSSAAQRPPLSPREALERVAHSPLSIETSTQELADFYSKSECGGRNAK
jgi:glycosyltransferase involved in cell wall biosynthesis